VAKLQTTAKGTKEVSKGLEVNEEDGEGNTPPTNPKATAEELNGNAEGISSVRRLLDEIKNKIWTHA